MAPVSIINGLSPQVRSSIVGTGITDEAVGGGTFASALESSTTGYRNFDYNYLAMRWQRGTNISDGITVGTEVLFGPGRRSFATPVMVLMADGRHTAATDPQDALATALAAHPDMLLFTVSFGENADTVLMERLAIDGGGTWFHADDFSALSKIFEEIARSAGVTLIE